MCELDLVRYEQNQLYISHCCSGKSALQIDLPALMINKSYGIPIAFQITSE